MDNSLGSAYQLMEILGEGGMGTVWRALDRRTGEQVAAKLLQPRLSRDADVVAKFVRERTVLVRLRHAGIVSIRDFVLEGERIAIVMDLVSGGDLGALVRRHGTLPPAMAARMTASLAEALDYAHAQDVVHCDVKPANVLVDEATGALKLTDFGVSRILHGATGHTTGTVAGTPVYIAPEILSGSRPTPAVDVYALGMVLYELLAGRAPFAGGHGLSALHSAFHMVPRRLDGMPDALWTVITACTAKEPSARPPLSHVIAMLRAAAPEVASAGRIAPVSREHPLSATAAPLAAGTGTPLPGGTGAPLAAGTGTPGMPGAADPGGAGAGPGGVPGTGHGGVPGGHGHFGGGSTSPTGPSLMGADPAQTGPGLAGGAHGHTTGPTSPSGVFPQPPGGPLGNGPAPAGDISGPLGSVSAPAGNVGAYPGHTGDVPLSTTLGPSSSPGERKPSKARQTWVAAGASVAAAAVIAGVFLL
ncbi:serine/threonine protein kinase, partial [Nonomuraea sp. NN258]|uniref:serine/threonine-protein kinase n=1 Tax=Nonomuraea antri TaxID=2730852 RepID=UPI00156A30AF